MFDQQSSSGPPQFGTAEYQGSPAGDRCKVCGQPLPGVYYRANRAMVCAGCAERVRVSVPADNHAAFVRALIFGFGGFIAGLVLYAGFTIITEIEIGFVSVAVGWLVGKAMMFGSRGIGGRRYQVVAVVLTYAAVSLAFVPIAIHFVNKQRPHPPSQQQSQPLSPGATSGAASGQPSQASPNPAPNRPQPTLMAFLGKVLLFGLASPFLQLQSGFSGFIGLVILFAGMQFAWRITRGRPKILVDGPYDNSKSLAT